MAKKSILTIRVPVELKNKIAALAEEQGVSINQLAMYMFSKEIGRMEAGRKINAYREGYSKEKIFSDFDEVMSKVKKKPVPAWDRFSG